LVSPAYSRPKTSATSPPLPRLLQTDRSALARIEQRPGNTPVARAGAEHQTAARQSLLKRIDHLGIVEDIGCTRGAGNRIGARKVLWLHEHQARQPHVLHGARSAANVAGMTGIDQHHSNVV